MPLVNRHSHRPCGASLLVLSLLLCSAAWADSPLLDRYQRLQQVPGTTIPGSTITLTSREEGKRLAAEALDLLPYPYATVAAALREPQNWCRFMPLHFNIKGCTVDTTGDMPVLNLYSGRKHYQSPEESYAIAYHFTTLRHGEELALLLSAAAGPANTRDYRIELTAIPVAGGTLLQMSSSYTPSLLSSMLTRGYLSTLGRDKVGFSRNGPAADAPLVQGVRGVLERNVMRYHLAIGSFLANRTLPEAAQYEASLGDWFARNESYPLQLHEMSEAEYRQIKLREWQNQQRLQRQLDEALLVAEAGAS